MAGSQIGIKRGSALFAGPFFFRVIEGRTWRCQRRPRSGAGTSKPTASLRVDAPSREHPDTHSRDRRRSKLHAGSRSCTGFRRHPSDSLASARIPTPGGDHQTGRHGSVPDPSSTPQLARPSLAGLFRSGHRTELGGRYPQAPCRLRRIRGTEDNGGRARLHSRSFRTKN